MSRCWSGLIDAKRSLSKAGHENPHDEAHRLILCRSYDIKLQKTGDFWAKCTKFIPFAWKCPQAILRASCRKAGCAFLLQREFSPLAVRFWEPIASLDRQNRSNSRRKISARETYSPPPFIICKEDVHNAQLHRIKFRQADEFSLKAEEVPIMV